MSWKRVQPDGNQSSGFLLTSIQFLQFYDNAASIKGYVTGEFYKRYKMKKVTIFLVGLLLGAYPDFIQSQERLQPFVISPFIGDKLDRVEEEYFKIFPTLTDFQEAVFYINPECKNQSQIK